MSVMPKIDLFKTAIELPAGKSRNNSEMSESPMLNLTTSHRKMENYKPRPTYKLKLKP